MSMTTTSGAAILTPDQIHDLIVRPVYDQSIAAQASTVISTSSSGFRIPMVTADPQAAWVNEGAEITPSDQTLYELEIGFKKIAGLTIISNELANDSSPEAAGVIGDGLARDISRKLDSAWVAASTTFGPAGLGSLTTTTVDAGAAWTDLDPFAEALAGAEAAFSTIDNFIANPADALALSTLKEATGSNLPLLGRDPTKLGKRQVLGVPLLVSTSVAPGEIWGIPKARCILVVRSDTTVEIDGSPFFTSDRTAIRAIFRCGFGWTYPLAVVKIALD